MNKLGMKVNWKSLPVLLVLTVCLTGLLVWATVATARQQILISVDGKAVTCYTMRFSVGEVLAEAGIGIGPRDLVHPALGTRVTRNMKIEVRRAVQVQLAADGTTRKLLTAATTVGDVLREVPLTLAPLDQVNMPLQSAVSKGLVIRVTRVAEKMIAEQYPLPVPLERRQDNSLERGSSYLAQQGQPGLGERSVKVTYHDGQPVSRTTLVDRVLRPTLSQIVAFGTLATVSRGGNVLHFRSVVDAMATAYSSATGRYTATGRIARFGVVAVDPRVISLGTRLYVEGYGYATALDTGGAIKGNRIDVFFQSEAQCNSWGQRQVKVYLLE